MKNRIVAVLMVLFIAVAITVPLGSTFAQDSADLPVIIEEEFLLDENIIIEETVAEEAGLPEVDDGSVIEEAEAVDFDALESAPLAEANTILDLSTGSIVFYTSNGICYKQNNGIEVPYTSDGSLVITASSGTSNTIQISDGNHKFAIDNLKISTTVNSPIDVKTGATLTLVLSGADSIINAGAPSKRAGIHVPSGATLNIEGTGMLSANGDYVGAGIGGNDAESCGTINISGNVNVTATSNGLGAAIGGGGADAISWTGNAGSGGIINIFGNATVTATNSLIDGGAGIGGGTTSASGKGGNSGNITITNATVIASSRASAGIGSGACIVTPDIGSAGSVENITITNSKVTASSENGAGIGGAQNGNGGDIAIAGNSTVNSYSTNSAYDIGGGKGSTSGGNVKIYGDSKLILSATENDPSNGSNAVFNISECEIISSGINGAAIHGLYSKVTTTNAIATPAAHSPHTWNDVYQSGSMVTVTADTSKGSFIGWTVTPATVILPNVSPTTFTMPRNDVHITANFDNPPVPTPPTYPPVPTPPTYPPVPTPPTPVPTPPTPVPTPPTPVPTPPTPVPTPPTPVPTPPTPVPTPPTPVPTPPTPVPTPPTPVPTPPTPVPTPEPTLAPLVTHVITATTSGGGSMNAMGNVITYDGTDRTFYITPVTGWNIGSVYVDGKKVGIADNSYTFHGVRENHTIHVEFVKIGGAPKTGDFDELWQYALLMLVATAVVVPSVILFSRKQLH